MNFDRIFQNDFQEFCNQDEFACFFGAHKDATPLRKFVCFQAFKYDLNHSNTSSTLGAMDSRKRELFHSLPLFLMPQGTTQ